MGRDAVLNDCAQQLRQSPFEFEQLLGSSVATVWQALSSHVERQLLARKGVSVALLGKFAFLREVQPLVPVFILADRFASAYGVSWKRPPPALLTPTVDANLSIIGADAGLPKEQTLRALETLVAFLGSRLQKGTASGRLRLGNIGALCFEGKALSFAFHPNFVRAVSQSAPSTSASRAAATEELRRASKPLQRSASTDSGIPAVQRVTPSSASAAPAPVEEEEAQERRSHHHHHHKKTNHQSHRHSRSAAHLDAPDPAEPDDALVARSVLPRFLVASKSVPDGAKVNRQTPGSPYALALQGAFEREREQRDRSAQAVAAEDAAIARRHHGAQLRKLQESAERALGRRELNAFLSGQMADAHAKQRAERLAAARACDGERASILPREPAAAPAARREAKRALCRRLGEQVAAKDALARDQRALEQAEAAFFSAQLQAQSADEQRARREQLRVDKQALADGWRQQQALRGGR